MMGIAIGASAMTAFAGLLLIAALFAGTARPTPKPSCMDDATREHVREVMLVGIERALQDHTTRLFATRMREYTSSVHPAMTGLNNGITAYVNIRNAVKEWQPPTC